MRASSGEVGPVAGPRPGLPSTTPLWRAAARTRFLPSKFEPPRLHAALVDRRRLSDHLVRTAAVPLVVLSAPPGSGKTVALVQWMQVDRRPVAWLHVDAGDNDPAVFVTGVAATVSPVAEAGPQVLELLKGRAPRLRDRVVPLLGTALAAASPFLLVLDDAHLLENAECWDYLTLLLRQLPDGATIAIGSREDPPLPLARLHAQGDLVSLGQRELALTREEAAQLLRMHDVDAAEVMIDDLLGLTEGWVSGLTLALLAGEDSAPADLAARLRGDQREIAAYLLGEVLRRQAPDVQRFLLETAILDELSAPLCAAVTGRTDAGDVLDDLESRHVFVTAMDDCNEWYRYHHLFAELLRTRLERRAPRAVAGLHRRAARWNEAHARAERAVAHWLAAGEPARTVELVERTCDLYLETGRQESARRLLQLFTEEQLLAHPGLAVTAGWVYAACIGTPDEQLHWAHIVSRLKVDDEPAWDGATTLRSSLTMLRAELAAGGMTRQREDFRECTCLETRVGTRDYVDARMGYARALYLTGSPRIAANLLRELLVVVEDPRTAAGLCDWLALIAQDQGRWRDADETLAVADAQGERLHLDEEPCLCSYLPTQLAHARQLSHHGDRAAMAFARAVGGYVERMVHRAPWILLLAHVTLAEVALEQDDLDAARGWSAQAAATLATYPDAGILAARSRRLQRALEERSLAVALTRAERRVLDLLPTHLTPPQIGAELFLSHNTVKTHLRAIYRKLGASSRAEAVAHSRELGLLKP